MADDQTEASQLPFGTFARELDTTAQAVATLLKHQWPVKWTPDHGASTLLKETVTVALNSYRTIVYVCGETPPDPARKVEFSVSCSPLARTILDSVFAVVFLFEDLPSRVDWYYRAGWRDADEEYQRYQAAYGTNPDWADWLADLMALVDGFRSELEITDAEVQNKKKDVPYWPNPGKMKQKAQSQVTREYLQYLDDWFYKELSADSHLSWTGLARRGGILGDRKRLDKYRSDCVFTAATLLLALLSEIQLEMRWPDITPRLQYVWNIISPYWGPAGELYERRYRELP